PPNGATFQQMASTAPDANAPQKYWEIRIAWSEYANQKWTPKQLSKEIAKPFLGFVPLILTRVSPTNPRQYVLRSEITQDSILNVIILIRYTGQGTHLSFFPELANFANDAVPVWTFRLSDPHERVMSGDTTDRVGIIDLNYSYLLQDESTLLTPNFYQPFFQSLNEQNKLSIAGSDFLRTTIGHKLLFSNDVTIPDFENNISHPFFYTDTDSNRTYFATPVRTARRPPIFPGLNEIAVFGNAAAAPLRMFKTSVISNSVVPAPVGTVVTG